MTADYLEPAGIIIPPASLEVPRAKALAGAVVRLPYVSLVECRRIPSDSIVDAVVIDVEVERPQKCKHDIRRVERVAIHFAQADDDHPEAFPLRTDFPAVQHLLAGRAGFTRSLCLYQESWQEIAIQWTPASFVERIRFWLAETAKGTLHPDDQPPEQLLYTLRCHIILPHDLFEKKGDGEFEELRIGLVDGDEDHVVFIADRGQADNDNLHLALSFRAAPQNQGTIRNPPQNLHQLDEFVRPAGLPIVDNLRKKLPDWNVKGKKDLLRKKLLLIIAFPLTRDGRTVIDATQVWCFLTEKTAGEIGVDIGLFQESKGTRGEKLYGELLQVKADPELSGKSVGMHLVSPTYDIAREACATLSASLPDARNILAVGAGALGSQLIRNLAQEGFGKWRIVDLDVLFPHNLARHSLTRWALGHPKATCLAMEINDLLKEPDSARGIQANILKPRKNAEQVERELADADLILDLSASVPVSRHLASTGNSETRQIAVFLNPRGTDLVILVEDSKRAVRLDSLEMQYYRALINDPRLAQHLAPPQGRSRYARSCREVTFQIPSHLVAMHSAIGAHAVRQSVDGDAAAICVWAADPMTLDVVCMPIPVNSTDRHQYGDWALVVDQHVRLRMAELRREKLPNETGGILIGARDHVRKVIYVVDALRSPPDSGEWNDLYIRGNQGLRAEVDRIQRLTLGQLDYVGEWHSHPDNCSIAPSTTDLAGWIQLTESMAQAGLPELMAIAGESGRSSWYVGQTTEAWEIDV